MEPSVGSKGDSYDNVLAETSNDLYKAELIHRRAPWKTKEACSNLSCISRQQKLRQTTTGNSPVRPPRWRSDLNQTASLKTGGDSLGVLPDGSRDILGIWIENTEGAKFWMRAFNDLKTRGVHDILIAMTDDLKGMPEALQAVFSATTLQTCIVHLIRSSLDFASWQDRKELAAAIEPIYTAVSAGAAEAELDAFAQGSWSQKFPTVVNAWRRAWDKVIPFFAFPPEVRRVIYTTNAIESVNVRLRKIIKTRGHFPSDHSAAKLIWLTLRNIPRTEDGQPTTGNQR